MCPVEENAEDTKRAWEIFTKLEAKSKEGTNFDWKACWKWFLDRKNNFINPFPASGSRMFAETIVSMHNCLQSKEELMKGTTDEYAVFLLFGISEDGQKHRKNIEHPKDEALIQATLNGNLSEDSVVKIKYHQLEHQGINLGLLEIILNYHPVRLKDENFYRTRSAGSNTKNATGAKDKEIVEHFENLFGSREFAVASQQAVQFCKMPGDPFLVLILCEPNQTEETAEALASLKWNFVIDLGKPKSLYDNCFLNSAFAYSLQPSSQQIQSSSCPWFRYQGYDNVSILNPAKKCYDALSATFEGVTKSLLVICLINLDQVDLVKKIINSIINGWDLSNEDQERRVLVMNDKQHKARAASLVELKNAEQKIETFTLATLDFCNSLVQILPHNLQKGCLLIPTEQGNASLPIQTVNNFLELGVTIYGAQPFQECVESEEPPLELLKFLQGEVITPAVFESVADLWRIPRRELLTNLYQRCTTLDSSIKRKQFTVYHQPSSGASTIGRQLLWELRSQFPCLVITKNTENNDLIALLKTNFVGKQKALVILLDTDVPLSDRQIKDFFGILNVAGLKFILIHLIRGPPPITEKPVDGIFQLSSSLTSNELLKFREFYKKVRSNLPSDLSTLHMFPLLAFQNEFTKIDQLVDNYSEMLSDSEKLLLSSVSLLWLYTNLPIPLSSVMRLLGKKKHEAAAVKWAEQLGKASELLIQCSSKYSTTGIKPPLPILALKLLTFPARKVQELNIHDAGSHENVEAMYHSCCIQAFMLSKAGKARLDEIFSSIFIILQDSDKEYQTKCSQLLFKVPKVGKLPQILKLSRDVHTCAHESQFEKFASIHPHIRAYYARYLYNSDIEKSWNQMEIALIEQEDSNLFAMKGDLCRYHYVDTKQVEYYERGIQAYTDAQKCAWGNKKNLIALINKQKLYLKRLDDEKDETQIKNILSASIYLLDQLSVELSYKVHDNNTEAKGAYHDLCWQVYKNAHFEKDYPNLHVPLKIRMVPASFGKSGKRLLGFSELKLEDLYKIISVTSENVKKANAFAGDYLNYVHSVIWVNYRDSEHSELPANLNDIIAKNWKLMKQIVDQWSASHKSDIQALFLKYVVAFLQFITKSKKKKDQKAITDLRDECSNKAEQKYAEKSAHVRFFVGKLDQKNTIRRLLPVGTGESAVQFLENNKDDIEHFTGVLTWEKGDVHFYSESLSWTFRVIKKRFEQLPEIIRTQARNNGRPRVTAAIGFRFSGEVSIPFTSYESTSPAVPSSNSYYKPADSAQWTDLHSLTDYPELKRSAKGHSEQRQLVATTTKKSTGSNSRREGNSNLTVTAPQISTAIASKSSIVSSKEESSPLVVTAAQQPVNTSKPIEVVKPTQNLVALKKPLIFECKICVSELFLDT